MENGPPCKKRMEVQASGEDILQGTSLALNFVTYQEFNTLRLEHEHMKSQMQNQLQAMRESILSDIHKTLFDELDAVKSENNNLKKEITHLKRIIGLRNNKNNCESGNDSGDFDCCTHEGIDTIENGSTKSFLSNPPVPGKEALSFLKNTVSFYGNNTSSSSSSNNSHINKNIPSTASDCNYDLSKVATTAAHNGNSNKAGIPPPHTPLISHTIDDVNWEHAVLTPNKPTPESDSVYSQRTQLLPEYNIWVNRSKLHALLQEAESAGNQGPAVVLRRVMMLVFSIEEMAHSRGQGIQHKSTDIVQMMHKEPLDPVKVQACKDYMRKWCLERGLVDPTDKAINSVITHQITYARTKLKRMANKFKTNSIGASLESGDIYKDDFSSCHEDDSSQGTIKEEFH